MVERGRYGGCEVHDWCEGGKKGVERRGIERERERGRDVRERIKKDRERERCQSGVCWSGAMAATCQSGVTRRRWLRCR